MKESLEKKYQENRITEEEKITYKKHLTIKKILLEVLYIFMVIFSFVKIRRISVFFYALGGGKVSFYTIAVVAYFVTLFIVILDNTITLIFILLNN